MASQPTSDAPSAAGVETRFRRVYEDSFAFVWRSLRRLGIPQRDLPDAAQEVFMVVHRKLPGFEGRSRLTTWLFRICFHVASGRNRRAHVRREVLDADAGDARGCEPAADRALEQQQSLQLLGEVLDAMALDNRAVFILFELEQLSGSEIAEALGLPLGTVYSKLRKARAVIEESFRRAERGVRDGVRTLERRT